MGKLWSLAYVPCATVHVLLLWSCATAQEADFLSVDCGSKISYTDPTTNIEWTSDASLMTEGETLTADNFPAPLNTLRLFSGNQSKYCYRLSNGAVTPGAFFLVRASFWLGTTPPSTPKNPDGYFRFKLLIGADEWHDVVYGSSTTNWLFYECYTRALHNSIDICLARSSSDGDDPFISALELRPLPSSLSATHLMNTTNLNIIYTYHDDSGGSAPASARFTSRYPSDPFDRVWQPASAPLVFLTEETNINTSEDNDKPPVKVLQTAVQSETWTYQNRDVNAMYFCVIYFAEIDGKVNASGQRVFNVVLNGERTLNEQPIDVFQEVGAFASYEIAAGNISTDSQGNISFTFSATSTSLFPPMFAATELFTASSNPFSFGSASDDVMAIEDLKASMNLSSYTGDPCLPIGFGYSWLTCFKGDSSTGGPKIQSISLSNHLTSGEIPETINNLTMLNTIFLDGNNLEGSIPDMSALVNLQILDLSNNKLSGPIPEYLGMLENLNILNLENNNLTGEIPADLLQRKQASKLDFRYSGNSLCDNSSNVTCTLPPFSSSSKSKHNVGLIVGVAIGVLFVMIVASALVCFFLFKSKPQSTLSKSSLSISTQNQIPLYPSSHSNQNSATSNVPIPMPLVQELTNEEINYATNNFSTQIGRGGFGPVFKGILKNGNIVAVKVSSNSSHQGSKEFLNEVCLLSRIHHKNLVELLGFCKEGELMLVYEFMSKGSLFDCLHGEAGSISPLSWRTRLNILVDAAQGLDYLHHGCHPPIIHRDIKSSNILLNDKLEAKISDFGTSRSSFVTATGAPPTTLMGSMGYLDPEYFVNMKLTEKVDVYSFGVLLFEVVCGRRVLCFDASHKETHIVEWIKPYIDRGATDIIVDDSLEGNYNHSSVWKVLDVALACVQLSKDQRPNMSIVFSELKEAQCMEFETSKSDMFNTLPIMSTFKENDSLLFTHVLPR